MTPYRLKVEKTPQTLGAIELTSIARGYRVVDQMVKRAPITLLDARPCSPGKFLVVITGDVASVDEALQIGTRESGSSLFGTIFIPDLMPEVVAAINRTVTVPVTETIGVIESFSAVSVIEASDAAIKAASIGIESISLLQGLGGKAFAVFAGELTDVQTAVDAARGRIPDDMFVDLQVIAQVSPELIALLPGRP
ncbi:MAG: BMC domain-containing protein [Spirochaetaceae bacterium]|nr:MAG: BMC domain-containing protein [Spirochaetaceae bacterium]